MNSENRTTVELRSTPTLATLQTAINELVALLARENVNPADVNIDTAEASGMSLQLVRVTLTDGSCVYDLRAL